MSHDVSIPDAAFKQHMIALGKTGSGKSTALRVLVERLLDAKKRVSIIDPKGDWWGLKLSASGKSAGYPVVIFGGEHADVPINAHAGGHIAELVATGNRPCIIDLGGWSVGDRTRFFMDYAAALFRNNKSPLWQVIDEVHNFAPQGKVFDPDSGKMLHWANRLASEGRGKAVTLMSASQRPQKCHKDFVTSMETLIAMRVIHPLDRAAIKDWIDGCPDREKGREVLESLASMPRGDGWVWSPEINFGPKRLTFPMFKTYDSFAAPTGEGTSKLRGWAEVDLEDVKAKLATVVEESQANDPRHLRQRIVELQRQLESEKAKKPAASAPVDKVKENRVEVYVLKDGQLKRAESIIDQLKAVMTKAQDLATSTAAIAAPIAKSIELTKAVPPAATVTTTSRVAATTLPAKQQHVSRLPAHAPSAKSNGAPRPARDVHAREHLEGPERRVLDSLAFWESIGVNAPGDAAVAFKAGYSPTSSAYERPRGKLRTLGLAEFRGGGVAATAVLFPDSLIGARSAAR